MTPRLLRVASRGAPNNRFRQPFRRYAFDRRYPQTSLPDGGVLQACSVLGGTIVSLASGKPGSTERAGMAAGLTAYVLWGLLPLFWKELDSVSLLEVMAHRVLWAFPVCLGFLALAGRARSLAKLFSGRLLGGTLIASCLISLNWSIFVHSVQVGEVFRVSVAYLLFPVVSVLIGCLVFGERLGPRHRVAVSLAIAAVVTFTLAGEVNMTVAGLSVTFSLYGAVRKAMNIDSLLGLTGETLVLTVPALAIMAWLGSSPGGAAFGGALTPLLLLAGPITALPLYFFAYAAVRMPLGKLSMLAYIGPGIMALLAFFVFEEKISGVEAFGVGLTLASVALYVWRGGKTVAAAPEKP